MHMEKNLELLIQLDKELDDVYRRAAQVFGLSDTALWVLYELFRRGQPMTQLELCRMGYYPKQTIHSLVRRFAQEGIVSLQPHPESGKEKLLCLTPAGKALAARTALPLYEAEKRAIARFSPGELDAYLQLQGKLVTFLREETQNLSPEETVK